MKFKHLYISLTVTIAFALVLSIMAVKIEASAQCVGPDGNIGTIVGEEGDTYRNRIPWPQCAYYAALEFEEITGISADFTFSGDSITKADRLNWVTTTDIGIPVEGAIVVYGNHYQIVREVHTDGIVVQGMNEKWTNDKDGCVYKYKIPYTLLINPNDGSILADGLLSFGGFKGYIYPRLKQTTPVEESTIPGKPILVTPVNESVISDSSIQFQWQPVAGATEYLLCIRRWYNIKPIFLRPVGSETTYLYDNLPSDNVVYYWWVLAGNVTGWGQPSDEHSFVNGTLPPPQQLAPTDPRSPTRPSDLTLLSPANNSVIPGKEVTFEWSKTSGATSYYLYLQKIGEQHTIRKQIRNSTNYYHDQLDADGSTYKWKVEAKIWWLFSRTSTTWEFINEDDDTERRDKELNICEEWSAANSGGYGTTVDQWDISELPAGASFDIKFDTYQVPDKIVIQYQGVTVYDSGWRGQQRYIDNNPHLYPGGLAGPGQEELEGFFRKGSDDHFILTVFGPESSTEWRYYMRARCQD